MMDYLSNRKMELITEEVREFLLDPRIINALVRCPLFPSWLPTAILAAEKGRALKAAELADEYEMGGGSDDKNSNPNSSVLTLTTKKDQPLNLKAIHKIQKLQNTLYHDVFKVTTHPFIRGDKFGPDVIAFQMPLPMYFPRKTGLSIHALQLTLEDYVAARRKERLIEKSTSLSAKDMEAEDARLRLEEMIRETKKKQSLMIGLYRFVIVRMLSYV